MSKSNNNGRNSKKSKNDDIRFQTFKIPNAVWEQLNEFLPAYLLFYINDKGEIQVKNHVQTESQDEAISNFASRFFQALEEAKLISMTNGMMGLNPEDEDEEDEGFEEDE